MPSPSLLLSWKLPSHHLPQTVYTPLWARPSRSFPKQSCLLVDHDSHRFAISVHGNINWLNLYLTITFISSKQHTFDWLHWHFKIGWRASHMPGTSVFWCLYYAQLHNFASMVAASKCIVNFPTLSFQVLRRTSALSCGKQKPQRIVGN